MNGIQAPRAFTDFLGLLRYLKGKTPAELQERTHFLGGIFEPRDIQNTLRLVGGHRTQESRLFRPKAETTAPNTEPSPSRLPTLSEVSLHNIGSIETSAISKIKRGDSCIEELRLIDQLIFDQEDPEISHHAELILESLSREFSEAREKLIRKHRDAQTTFAGLKSNLERHLTNKEWDLVRHYVRVILRLIAPYLAEPYILNHPEALIRAEAYQELKRNNRGNEILHLFLDKEVMELSGQLGLSASQGESHHYETRQVMRMIYFAAFWGIHPFTDWLEGYCEDLSPIISKAALFYCQKLEAMQGKHL